MLDVAGSNPVSRSRIKGPALSTLVLFFVTEKALCLAKQRVYAAVFANRKLGANLNSRIAACAIRGGNYP